MAMINKPNGFDNNPAKYFRDNFRDLFGKNYNEQNLINMITEEYDEFTSPSDFKTIKSKMKESGDLDLYDQYIKSFNVPEEELLKHGYHQTKTRLIGNSYAEEIKRAEAKNSHGVYKTNRTIDASIRDSLMDLKFDNNEDFEVLNNAINFYNQTYNNWEKYDSIGDSRKYVNDFSSFFDEYSKNNFNNNNYTEHYITNFLDRVQTKGNELGYNFNLQDMINERKAFAREEKRWNHEANKANREYRIKQERINQLEEKMKSFDKNSPEYKALDLERNNIMAEIHNWTADHKTLELPPPREGAPMYEGGAVPSIIANDPDVVNANINTTTQTSTPKKYDFHNMQVGDNFVNDYGDYLVYSKFSPKDTSMGIDFDTYEFVNVATGEPALYRNFKGMEKMLNKVDNNVSLDAANNVNNRRRNFYREYKQYNDASFDPDVITLEEFEQSQRNFFNNRVVPAYQDFIDQYENTKDFVNLSDKEKKYIENVKKELEKNTNTSNTNQTTKRQRRQGNRQQQQQVPQDDMSLENFFSQEEIANFTDDDILEFAQSGDEYNRAIELRDKARKNLGMDPINRTVNTNNETSQIKNNFRGGRNTSTTYTDRDIIDRVIGKQNPGKNTSRVFDYNGKQYAIYKNFEVNSKDLTKGIIGGQIVDLETKEVLKARDAFYNLNQALINGDFDAAIEELNNISDAGHTLPRKDIEKIIVDGVNQRQEQTQNEQQQANDTQHNQTQNENQQQHEETKNEMNENHESNKETSTQGNTTEPIEPEIDTSETPNNAPDLPDAPDAKTRKQRLRNARERLGKDITKDGKTTRKHFTGQRVANNSKRSIKKRKLSGKKFKVKGGNLKQVAANTFVNIATETVKETISKNVDELKKFGKHPNLFESIDDFADLTDADIDHYLDNMFGIDINTKKEMKKEWLKKRKLGKTARDSAKKRKIIDSFDDYMDNFFSYNGYSSIEGQARFNPDPEIGWDEADFKNPDSYTRRRIDFEVDENGNVKMNKFDDMDTIEIEQNRLRRGKGNVVDDDIFGWMKKHKLGLGEAINVLGTVSAYKDARKQGHSVASSAVRAAGSFVMGEMLGFWGSLGWGLAKGLPKAAIKGAETLYKENRKMNSAANQYGLGGNFQDTQQLATMRQSGMEMAKMAQYNLQQTLMGNEATHLHR